MRYKNKRTKYSVNNVINEQKKYNLYIQKNLLAWK